jgi:hypothetical protein
VFVPNSEEMAVYELLMHYTDACTKLLSTQKTMGTHRSPQQFRIMLDAARHFLEPEKRLESAAVATAADLIDITVAALKEQVRKCIEPLQKAIAGLHERWGEVELKGPPLAPGNQGNIQSLETILRQGNVVVIQGAGVSRSGGSELRDPDPCHRELIKSSANIPRAWRLI